MKSRIRSEWQAFARAAPGERFVHLHERKQRDGKRLAHRVFWWTTGIVLILAGFIMLFTPGPGLLGMAFGIACIAQESRAFARRCDHAELRLRAAWTRWRAKR